MQAARPPRGTHHDRILTRLRDRITSGEWQPGFQLPFETQLAESHGVSRMTMNKVLAQLAASYRAEELRVDGRREQRELDDLGARRARGSEGGGES